MMVIILTSYVGNFRVLDRKKRFFATIDHRIEEIKDEISRVDEIAASLFS